MTTEKYDYIILGAGLAGCYAVEGIRSQDKKGSILLVGSEIHPPYDRPPLTKQLWFGKKKLEEIFARRPQYFTDNHVDMLLNTRAVQLEVTSKTVLFADGGVSRYRKLLLATGGTPRRLGIEGGNLESLYYYRYLDDYLRLKTQIHRGSRVLVIGGGFIGSEIAAALQANQAEVTVLIRGQYLVEQIFPKPQGLKIQQDYVGRGVNIITKDNPVSIIRRNGRFTTRTETGLEIESDLVIAGIGIEPEIELAAASGLSIQDGIQVNEFLQTSMPDIYAAGDNANFSYLALDRHMRIEHWDNAVNQGKTAGMNMAGAKIAYDYMPYFFSDLFDFGYEAVGLISSKLQTVADWRKENDTGVIYYLQEGIVCGVMMCNVWGKVDIARELIRRKQRMTAAQLHEVMA